MNHKDREPTMSLSLSPIWDSVKRPFFSPARLTTVVTMAKRGIQREHWFDMELETIFSEMDEREIIKSWERQCPTRVGEKKGRCDFKIELADLTTVIEVKVLQQRSPTQTRVSDWTLWASRNDFAWDIQKMLAVPGATCHYLLVFAYPARADS
jgi:hypothetical protein